jgi:hypothetical protein
MRLGSTNVNARAKDFYFRSIRLQPHYQIASVNICVTFLTCFSVTKFRYNEYNFVTRTISLYWHFTVFSVFWFFLYFIAFLYSYYKYISALSSWRMTSRTKCVTHWHTLYSSLMRIFNCSHWKQSVLCVSVTMISCSGLSSRPCTIVCLPKMMPLFIWEHRWNVVFIA